MSTCGTIHARQAYRTRASRWRVMVHDGDDGQIHGIIERVGHGPIYARGARVSPAAMIAHLNALAHHGSTSLPAELSALMGRAPLRAHDVTTAPPASPLAETLFP